MGRNWNEFIALQDYFNILEVLHRMECIPSAVSDVEDRCQTALLPVTRVLYTSQWLDCRFFGCTNLLLLGFKEVEQVTGPSMASSVCKKLPCDIGYFSDGEIEVENKQQQLD